MASPHDFIGDDRTSYTGIVPGRVCRTCRSCRRPFASKLSSSCTVGSRACTPPSESLSPSDSSDTGWSNPLAVGSSAPTSADDRASTAPLALVASPLVGLWSCATVLPRQTCPASGWPSGRAGMGCMSRLDLRSSRAGGSSTDCSSRVCLAALRRSHDLVSPADTVRSVDRVEATAAEASRPACLRRLLWLSSSRLNTPVGTTPFRMALPSTRCSSRLSVLVHKTSACRPVPSISHGQSYLHCFNSKSRSSPSALLSAP